jgi:hypothetical protein
MVQHTDKGGGGLIEVARSSFQTFDGGGTLRNASSSTSTGPDTSKRSETYVGNTLLKQKPRLRVRNITKESERRGYDHDYDPSECRQSRSEQKTTTACRLPNTSTVVAGAGRSKSHSVVTSVPQQNDQ